MKYQKTRFGYFEDSVLSLISKTLAGGWKARSISFLSILIGFYLGSNLTAYYLQKIGQRPLVVLALVLIIELIIRLRSRYKSFKLPFGIIIIDNLRIGLVYSIILEAFKLGS